MGYFFKLFAQSLAYTVVLVFIVEWIYLANFNPSDFYEWQRETGFHFGYIFSCVWALITVLFFFADVRSHELNKQNKEDKTKEE